MSVLALIPDKTLAGLIGVVMGFLSTLLFEKGQPFHVSSTNTMAAAASLALSASYASGLLLVTTEYGENLGPRIRVSPLTVSNPLLQAKTGAAASSLRWSTSQSYPSAT